MVKILAVFERGDISPYPTVETVVIVKYNLLMNLSSLDSLSNPLKWVAESLHTDKNNVVNIMTITSKLPIGKTMFCSNAIYSTC